MGPTAVCISRARSQRGMKVNDSAWVEAKRRVVALASAMARASPGMRATWACQVLGHLAEPVSGHRSAGQAASCGRRGLHAQPLFEARGCGG